MCVPNLIIVLLYQKRAYKEPFHWTLVYVFYGYHSYIIDMFTLHGYIPYNVNICNAIWFFQIKAYVVKAGELMLRIEMILNCTFEL